MSVDVGVSGAKSEPNVVPLCDILLVLLIIFMVITPVAQKGIDVKLPETSEEIPTGPSNAVVITVEADQNHTIKVNNDPVARDLLQSNLKTIFQTRPSSQKVAFIRADKTLPYSDVLSVIDIAKGAGIEVLGVYTTQYETEGQPQ